MEFVLLTMIVLIMIVAIVATKLTDNSYPFPFNCRETLFTQAEKAFQLLLENAVGEKYRVVNRVKLSDLVSVRTGVSKKASQKAQAVANGKYLDFVICDKETMKPVGVIDLVNTQGKGYKVTKDWFVSGALEASAIPHVRIKVKSGYSIDEIRQCLSQHIFLGKLTSNENKGTRIPAAMIRPRASKKSESTNSLPAPVSSSNELAPLSH